MNSHIRVDSYCTASLHNKRMKVRLRQLTDDTTIPCRIRRDGWWLIAADTHSRDIAQPVDMLPQSRRKPETVPDGKIAAVANLS